MHSRPYRSADRDDLLRAFDSNAGVFFAPEQRIQFEAFLDQPLNYFVAGDGNHIVGGGGYLVTGNVAELQWLLVDREHHRQGAGSLLLTSCIADILDLPQCRATAVECNQHAVSYFERWGFQVHRRVPDAYALGIDRVSMQIDLDDANRQLWQELISGGLPAVETDQPIPAIERYKEWSEHRYDPGYYLGGQLPPHLDSSWMGSNAKRKSAGLLAITALMTTIVYATSMSIDDNRWVRMAGTAMVVIAWIAAIRMYLGSRPNNRSPQ